MPPACLGRCLAGALKLLFRGSLPKVEGTFEAAELEEPRAARVVRDKVGVPHITAATDFDLFFLLGVVQGQDRLWQLHTSRSLAAGRVSAFAGKRAIELDRLARQLGFRALAEGDLAALKSDDSLAASRTLVMLNAFAAGINWSVSHGTLKGKLPIEFKLIGQASWEPWSVLDSLAIIRLYCFVMNFGCQHPLLRQGLNEFFGAERAAAWTCTSEQEPTIPQTLDEEACKAFRAADLSGIINAAAEAIPKGQGSNWWVIHGRHTTTGKPLLAGDPHLSVKVPGFWYEAHLNQVPTAGSQQPPIQGYGACCPGVPGLFVGQNGFCAWSVTLAYTDVEDVFLERVRRIDGKYLHRGEWHPCEERREVIAVKKEEPVEIVVRSTCHGVLLEGKPLLQFDQFQKAAESQAAADWAKEGEEVLIALAAISRRPSLKATIGLSELLRAGSFQAFDASLAHFSPIIALNVGYADVEGHIGYLLSGEVPKRKQPGAELLPLPGWTGEHDWQGFVPHSELPKGFDPPAGIIISANHKIVDSSYYPHYLGQAWKSGYRAQAIEYELKQLLKEGRKVGPEQMATVQRNQRSWAAVDFVRELRQVKPDEDTAGALELLTSWDGSLTTDSIPAALYQLAHMELVQLLLRNGCKAAGAPPAGRRWDGLDGAKLCMLVAGDSFDPNGMVKVVNELQGHLHINVLRILRASQSTAWASPADEGRHWWLEQAGGRDKAVNEAVRKASAQLQKLGGKNWRTSPRAAWGKLHTCHFMHSFTKNLGFPPGSPPFDLPSVEAGGDTNTIAQAGVKSPTDMTATVTNISLRVVFNLANLDDPATNRIIIPLGQSGQFNSRHYGDQREMWASGQLRPMLSTEAAVQKEVVSTMSFRGAA